MEIPKEARLEVKKMTCGKCKHCTPLNVCGGDCECRAKSTDGLTFEVSQDDDIRFYGDQDGQPCSDFAEKQECAG